VLMELVANAGRVVTREELQQKLWSGDTFVDFDVGLNNAIRKLRQALGDDADNPQYIETLAKRGYRFIAPVSESLSTPPLNHSDSKTSRLSRIWVWIGAAVCIVIVVLTFVGWTNSSTFPPHVSAITQLTDDGEGKCCRIATDGERIYFNEGAFESERLAQIAVNGGQTAYIPTTVNGPHLAAVDPGGSALLVVSGSSKDNAPSPHLWRLPLPAGEPHQFAGIEASDSDYFPDGNIVFTRGSDVFIAEKDGSQLRKLFSTRGIASEPRVAPNGKQIAFNVFTPNEVFLVISSLSGSTIRKIPASCCGRWTPDGKYLVFSNVDRPMKDLWILPIEPGLFRRSQQPLRLTNGPLSYGGSGVALSRDGKSIFAIGKTWKAEFVSYNIKSKRFEPFLGGISATELSFSRDGKWVAYLAYPDRSLWRSRADGTDRLQLTTVVDSPIISPDGKHICFFNSDSRLYLVDVDGNSPPKQIEGESAEVLSWSPDGQSLLLAPTIGKKDASGRSAAYLQTLDLQSAKRFHIPLPEGIESSEALGGAWWVDQELVVASVPGKLMTYEFMKKQWSDLLRGDFVSCAASVDRRYIYCTTSGPDPKAMRIRLADRKVETLTSLGNLRRTFWTNEISVSPDDSPVFTRDVGSQEIYALKLERP